MSIPTDPFIPCTYTVRGDHPTMARKDKHHKLISDAREWQGILERAGYENVTLDLEVPPGYRMLVEGDTFHKGDLYCRCPSESWKPCMSYGGRWNPRGYWPTIRKV
jgi:hypothetical protein